MALAPRSQSLRRAQLSARAPRAFLIVTCGVLVAVGLVSLLGTHDRPPLPSPVIATDVARAQAVAEGFARAYLTWTPSEPSSRQVALRQFAPAIADEERDDPLPGPRGGQTVIWSRVTSDVPIAGGRRITVVAQTTQGFTTLVVDTRTAAQGAISVTGFPAVVGSPPVAASDLERTGDPVDDAGLQRTVTRALANFLAGRRDALAADLEPGAVAVVPDTPLHLLSVDQTNWGTTRRELSVQVLAGLTGAGRVRLTYSVGVIRRAGRWFVSWIGSRQTMNGRS